MEQLKAEIEDWQVKSELDGEEEQEAKITQLQETIRGHKRELVKLNQQLNGAEPDILELTSQLQM